MINNEIRNDIGFKRWSSKLNAIRVMPSSRHPTLDEAVVSGAHKHLISILISAILIRMPGSRAHNWNAGHFAFTIAKLVNGDLFASRLR